MVSDTNFDVSRRSVLKGIAGATAAGAAGLSGVGTAAAAGESVALQYFHEDWQTITANLETVASMGFDAIWIQQPAQAKLDWSDQSGRNDPPLGYQPIDYRTFDSAFGTEADLQNLIEMAHANGVEVYIDTVMNHMATGQNPKYDFPAFGYDDFHHYGSITDWNDEYQLKHGELLGLPDLKQSSSYVRGQLHNYMQKMADLGADGYRFDAAKHIPEWFFADYANQWAEDLGMFRVGEVLSGSKSYVQNYVDQGPGMHAFDYPLYFVLTDVFNNGDMGQLQGAGLVAQDPFHAMPFVENHDQDAPSQYELAHAFVLTIEGYPVVYNLYPDWVLGNDNIATMVWVKRNLAGGQTIWRHTSSNLAIYEREGNLLVGLNNGGSSRSKWVQTSWTDTELEDYAGNAGNVTTDSNGWVQLTIPAEGWTFYAPTGQGSGGSGSGGGSTSSVTLQIDAPTADGESVFFTGDTASLTNWGTGVEGTQSNGVWELTIDDPGDFQWKARRGPAGGAGDVWESGDNHTTLTPTFQGWADGFTGSGGGGSGSGVQDGATYRITNVNSGKALDVANVSTDNGANVHQWDYVGGSNQQWTVTDLGNGYYELTANHSGKALDVASASTADGANVHQWDYVGGSNQQWAIEDVGDGYKLTARHSGKVLEVAGGGTNNGDNVQQWGDNGSSAQRWTLEQL